MTPEDFRTHGHALVDWIADYLEHVEQFPVGSQVQPGEIRSMLPEHPPTAAEPFEAVLADMDRVITPGLTHWQHPRFFAYFPANISYASILGDLAASGLGVQGMSWVTSPACTEVETLMMDWMQELLGLPERFRSTSEHGGGVIQGSASEASLVSILAARWRATGGAVNADGDTSRLVAYSTNQSHSSIEKGLRIAGIGTAHWRIVPHDEAFAMRPDELARMVADDVAAGLVPFWVCANRGTTSSMAFDPVAEIAEVAHAHGMWVHVDAAMSGIAALAPELRWVNDGLEQADSYCTNPHKWMGVNFDC
ncbi:MAG: pyridoxal-dependent decarboxylase, partial [Ilumatobacteraceae bacterium]